MHRESQRSVDADGQESRRALPESGGMGAVSGYWDSGKRQGMEISALMSRFVPVRVPVRVPVQLFCFQCMSQCPSVYGLRVCMRARRIGLFGNTTGTGTNWDKQRGSR